MKQQHNFIIKYVYQDGIEREDKDTEVGFNIKYKNVSFPVGRNIGHYSTIGDEIFPNGIFRFNISRIGIGAFPTVICIYKFRRKGE